MARDAIRRNPDGSGHLMAIRDDNRLVLLVKFHWTVASETLLDEVGMSQTFQNLTSQGTTAVGAKAIA
jgi:hypothetical protein